MTMKKMLGGFALTVAAAAFAAAPAVAQQGHGHGHGQAQGHAERQSHHCMMHNGAQMLLEHHRQDLGLSADQVSRLEAISAEMKAFHDQHRGHAQMQNASAEQRQAMHQQMTAQMRQHHERVLAVLTAEQRSRIEAMMQQHHAEKGAEGHARHGQGQHGEGGHGERMDCCQPGAECCKGGNCEGEHARHGSGSHS
jgi:DNA anti-recombination protein RmuC